LCLFQLPLFLSQLLNLVRVNSLESFLLLSNLIIQSDVVCSELIELCFVNCSVNIEDPSAITLDIKRL